MRPIKPNLNVAFTGHVDHGKSSLIGRLLLESGQIRAQEYEQYKREAKDKGRSDSALAYISDDRKEERERGLSIKPSYNQLEGDEYNFTLIDCPGHQYYTGNMIKGVSQSDAAVILVSAKDGVQPITKEHALISGVMSGDDVIIAISKMDAVGYDEERFREVTDSVADLLSTIHQEETDPSFVPVSAIEGRNVTSQDQGIEWYSGESLLEQMDELQEPEKRSDKPLRLPVDEKQTMSGIGTTVAGTIRTGNLKSDQEVVFKPSDTECKVRSIEMFNERIGNATARDNVGVGLSGVEIVGVETGDICGEAGHPASTAETVITQLTAIQQPPKIKPGTKLVFHAHSLQSPCEVTGASISDEPTEEPNQMGIVEPGQTGQVELNFPEPVAIERYTDFPSLGTFLLRDNNETLAYGRVTDLN